MTYKEFMKLLIENKTSGVYLFDSEEEYLNENIREIALSNIAIPDFNYIDFKEKSDYEKLKTSFETYPVMEDNKYVVWRNINLSKNSINEYKDIVDNLADDITKFPDFVSFFIFSNEKPFKGKFYKSIEKYGNVVKIDRLNNSELSSFIGKRFIKNGKKIQKSLISEIIERFSYLNKNSKIDLYDIVNTVDKIISNSKDEVVKKEDVREQLDQILNLNIFNLTDALSSRDLEKSMEIYLQMNEDIFMIYHMIIRQIRNMIGIKILTESGYSEKFIEKNLSIGQFEFRKIKSTLNNFSKEELFNLHDFLFEMDYLQKSKEFDLDTYLLIFINKMCRK